MAIRRRGRAAGTVGGLTQAMTTLLLTGRLMPDDETDDPFLQFDSEDAFRFEWNTHRVALLAEAQARGIGLPWAAIQFDKREG